MGDSGSCIGTTRGGAAAAAATAAVHVGDGGGGERLSVSVEPRLTRFVRPVEAVSVQHLEQQVVQGHFVLALHAVEMLHAFVAAENIFRN